MPRIVTGLAAKPLEEQPELLTADEAAPYLRTSARNARRLLANGGLDHISVQIGTKRLIARRALINALNGGEGVP